MTSKQGWVRADERLPTAADFGAFNRCEVILQCNPSGRGRTESWQVMRMGWLTFIGGNPKRPLWLQGEDKSGTPIENGSWFVTHWRPFPKFPAPVEVTFTEAER